MSVQALVAGCAEPGRREDEPEVDPVLAEVPLWPELTRSEPLIDAGADWRGFFFFLGGPEGSKS